MFNNEEMLKEIENVKDIDGKKELILNYLNLLRCTKMKRLKLIHDLNGINSNDGLVKFIYNIYLVGENLKV